MEMLPMESAEKAIQTITSLALRIQGLDEDDSKQITDDDDDDAMSSSSEDSATDSDEEMRVLRKKQRRSCASFSFSFSSRSVEKLPETASPAAQTTTGVKAAIEKLKNQRIALKKTKKDLLTLIKEDYPEELKEVALLLCTMPVTQVSVERLFSALKIFKRDQRSRLKEDILNALLLLKANSLND
jgi:hypothetical protein